MKPVLFFVLLSWLLGCGSQSTTGSKSDSHSAIAITKSDTTVYLTLAEKKLGTLYAGEKIEGTLEFENKTESPITIKEVKGSCGCMTITESFDYMKKGETKQLKYLINTFGKSNEEYFDVILVTSAGKFVVELSANIK